MTKKEFFEEILFENFHSLIDLSSLVNKLMVGGSGCIEKASW